MRVRRQECLQKDRLGSYDQGDLNGVSRSQRVSGEKKRMRLFKFVEVMVLIKATHIEEVMLRTSFYIKKREHCSDYAHAKGCKVSGR